MYKNIPNKTDLMCIIISGLILSSPVIHAEMYKWQDEEGRWHYTQSPPPGDIKAETIAPPPDINNESALNKVNEQQEKANSLREARLEDAEKKAKQKEFEELQAENCRRSQQRLATYSRPRGLILQEDGSRIRIDEEARQAGLKESREMIEKYCN